MAAAVSHRNQQIDHELLEECWRHATQAVEQLNGDAATRPAITLTHLLIRRLGPKLGGNLRCWPTSVLISGARAICPLEKIQEFGELSQVFVVDRFGSFAQRLAAAVGNLVYATPDGLKKACLLEIHVRPIGTIREHGLPSARNHFGQVRFAELESGCHQVPDVAEKPLLAIGEFG
jgi:hypothetical protein